MTLYKAEYIYTMERTNLKWNKTLATSPTILLDSGVELSKIFRKTREMTSLLISPRRQTCLLGAGAHSNGLQDVAEARPSPLHHRESHRLATQFSQFFRKNSVLVVSTIFHQKPIFGGKIRLIP